MTAPRLEISLPKIRHNARALVNRLGGRGISVTGVTKAVRGSPEIASALLRAGVRTLGDSRIENIARMRRANINTAITLIRSPMASQTDQVVRLADTSLNTELSILRKLSSAARTAQRLHCVVLMVELGDLREGIMPRDLPGVVQKTLELPNIMLTGIGTNLACQNGTSPDAVKMAELSALAGTLEARFGIRLALVSGGNSANLSWALSTSNVGRINALRLGESILFGREALNRTPIAGLFNDAITLVAEVIESKIKPSQPWGTIAQNAFGPVSPVADRGLISNTILAVGRQDIDPDGAYPPPTMAVLGASSDHLVLDAGDERPPVGSEIRFQLTYSALLRAITSPYVETVIFDASGATGDDDQAVCATQDGTGGEVWTRDTPSGAVGTIPDPLPTDDVLIGPHKEHTC